MTEPELYDLVVVGGGIAGLAAAWEATRSRPEARIAVLEAGDRFGGKLHPGEMLGHVVDRGADAFLVRTPAALDLCHELGLDDELVHPAQRSALLWSGGRLHPFPPGLVLGVPTDLDALAASGIISAAGIARARRDLDEPGTTIDGDITVGELVRRRLGDEVFDKLVSPLLSGINAGDADDLSLEAGTPQLAAAAKHGSLIRGARAQRDAGDPDAPVFASLLGGTGRLVEALVEQLRGRGVDLLLHTSVARVTGEHTGTARWRVDLTADGRDGSALADGVVLTAPGPVTGRLLETIAPTSAATLAAIQYASVVVVTLAYPRDAVAHALDASGVLVPEPEGLLMTACSFGSAKWPHWAEPDVALFRVSAGRFDDARHLAMPDKALIRHLHNELAPMLGIHATPLATEVTRWDAALPQYRAGHLDRLDAVDDDLALHAPHLALAGAGTRGIGIPACIQSGRAAALRVLGHGSVV